MNKDYTIEVGGHTLNIDEIIQQAIKEAGEYEDHMKGIAVRTAVPPAIFDEWVEDNIHDIIVNKEDAIVEAYEQDEAISDAAFEQMVSDIRIGLADAADTAIHYARTGEYQ